MNNSIDINCDLGESVDPKQWADDARLMPYISSCNIACGGHAGNNESIKVSVQNANSHQLAIGAHPSYPDKDNFGRTSLSLSEKELRQTLQQQIIAVSDACKAQSVDLVHVKPHGALYNDAATNLSLAMIIAEEIAKISSGICFMGLAESAMLDAANKVGLHYIHEGFMDRNYQQNKTLVPRSEPNALHNARQTSLQQALNFAQGRAIHTPSGQALNITVDSICLHGDNPDALAIAQELQKLFKQNSIAIKPSK